MHKKKLQTVMNGTLLHENTYMKWLVCFRPHHAAVFDLTMPLFST